MAQWSRWLVVSDPGEIDAARLELDRASLRDWWPCSRDTAFGDRLVVLSSGPEGGISHILRATTDPFRTDSVQQPSGCGFEVLWKFDPPLPRAALTADDALAQVWRELRAGFTAAVTSISDAVWERLEPHLSAHDPAFPGDDALEPELPLAPSIARLVVDLTQAAGEDETPPWLRTRLEVLGQKLAETARLDGAVIGVRTRSAVSLTAGGKQIIVSLQPREGRVSVSLVGNAGRSPVEIAGALALVAEVGAMPHVNDPEAALIPVGLLASRTFAVDDLLEPDGFERAIEAFGDAVAHLNGLPRRPRRVGGGLAAPLRFSSFDAVVERLLEGIERRHLVLPDAEDLAERLVVALISGHVILDGPPGTGKTTLAGLAAEAFGCTATVATATADWTTFDVIGGLLPTVGERGNEVYAPARGCATEAALRCAEIAEAFDPSRAPDQADNPQAHWLTIDEMSRAPIDRAFGPLFTALATRSHELAEFLLWFDPDAAAVRLPRSFRMIGTINTVDPTFVFELSRGLQRRFQFVYVGPPEAERIDEEIEGARAQAVEWWSTAVRVDGERSPEAALTGTGGEEALNRLATFVRTLRYGPDVGFPLGTAQVVDVLRHVLSRCATPDPDPLDAVDAAIADVVARQLQDLRGSALETMRELVGLPSRRDSEVAIEPMLEGWHRTATAIGRIGLESWRTR